MRCLDHLKRIKMDTFLYFSDTIKVMVPNVIYKTIIFQIPILILNFSMTLTLYETCDPFICTTVFGLSESS